MLKGTINWIYPSWLNFSEYYFCILGAKSYTVYKNMNFIYLLLSQFFTVIFSSELQIHFKIIKIFSVEAEMLLWILKDQRVYLHNVLFLACFNWEFFQGVLKIYDTMSLNQCTK